MSRGGCGSSLLTQLRRGKRWAQDIAKEGWVGSGEQTPASLVYRLCRSYPQEWLNQPQNALITGPLITFRPSPSCLWCGRPISGSSEPFCESPVFPQLTAPSPSGGVRGSCLPPLVGEGIASPPRNAPGAPSSSPAAYLVWNLGVWLCHLLPRAALCHAQPRILSPIAEFLEGLGLTAGLGLEGYKDYLEAL